MKTRKIVAATLAAVVAASAMAVTASAEAVKDQFIIGFGDADWKASFWGKDGDILDSSYETTAAYNGDGTYTVTLDLSKGYTNESFVDEETGDLLNLTTGNGIGAMGIQIYGEAEDTYANVALNITSVKFDGVDYPVTGASYTNNEDAGRRTNVYNAWASYDSTKEDHVSEDPDNATATLIDISGLAEWSVCEVTFDAYTVGGAEEAAPAEEAVPAEEVVDEAAPTEEAAEEAVAEETTAAAVEEAPAEDAAAVDTEAAPATGDKANADTGVEGVAVVAGLAVLAAGAVIVAKKRK